MESKLNYINFAIKEVNDSTDRIYEAFFEEDEAELKKEILYLITLLNGILNDTKNE